RQSDGCGGCRAQRRPVSFPDLRLLRHAADGGLDCDLPRVCVVALFLITRGVATYATPTIISSPRPAAACPWPLGCAPPALCRWCSRCRCGRDGRVRQGWFLLPQPWGCLFPLLRLSPLTCLLSRAAISVLL